MILLSLGLCSIPVGAKEKEEARDSVKTEQKDSASVSKNRKDKYEKTFVRDKSCVTARADGGFMALHKVNGKIYAELDKAYLEREMLIASTITGASDPNLASIGYKPQPPMHVRFSMTDSTIFLKEVSVLPDYDRNNEEMAIAVERSCMDPIIKSFDLFCENPSKTAFVFDVTSLFMTNYERLAPVKSGNSGGVNMKVSFNSSGCALEGIKAFDDNVSIRSMMSYTVSANLMGLILLKDDEPFTVSVTRSILLLPEKKMQPRISDSRVGIFCSSNLDFDSDSDKIERYSMIHRWDVAPSDTAAWKRGELVDPVRPITFYLDSAFPAEWKEPARKGVLRWNRAFEEIGIRNAIQVLDFPENDPEFDPDNLKYSCIRYVPAQIANAMGPSWVDPSTGEIINASIIVYNDMSYLVNRWRFCQTSQVDSRVRGRQLPKDILEESIEYVIAHEAGHCLGFMHNMAASAAYPTDSLRSASFTAKYGTTPSIMDYARFNYIAQPEDKGVSLTPPFLGPYDYFLVKYAYAPLPECDGMKGERPVLEKWVDEKAGDPMFRYGRQQILHRYDPSAIEEDLGDDPIRSSDYGAANIRYILDHLEEWITDEMDPDGSLRMERYEELARQYNRYLNAVMLNIGGIYLTSVKPGTEGDTFLPVPKARQKESVEWMVRQLKDCSWFNRKELTDKFPLRVELEPIFQYYTALELFSTYRNVILSSHVAKSPEDAYTLQNWIDDMYSSLFASTIRRQGLTSGEMILQKLYVSTIAGVAGKSGGQLVKMKGITSDDAYLPSARQMLEYGLGANRYLSQYLDLISDYEADNGIGCVAASTDFGPAGYGWQYRVNTRTIDNSKELLYAECIRVARLLEKRVKSAKGETKAHYQLMLNSLGFAR